MVISQNFHNGIFFGAMTKEWRCQNTIVDWKMQSQCNCFHDKYALENLNEKVKQLQFVSYRKKIPSYLSDVQLH